jgi:hypothetical protein
MFLRLVNREVQGGRTDKGHSAPSAKIHLVEVALFQGHSAPRKRANREPHLKGKVVHLKARDCALQGKDMCTSRQEIVHFKAKNMCTSRQEIVHFKARLVHLKARDCAPQGKRLCTSRQEIVHLKANGESANY